MEQIDQKLSKKFLAPYRAIFYFYLTFGPNGPIFLYKEKRKILKNKQK